MMPDCPILVTGASGLLGANLVWNLARRGARVMAASQHQALQYPGVPTRLCDLAQPDQAMALFCECRPGWVIHAAALTDVDACEAYPDRAWRANVEVTRNVAAAARRLGTRLIYISTDAVFGGDTGGYGEQDAVAPVNVYAWTKWQGEHATRGELPESLIARTNFYGWNAQPKASLAEWMLARLESGEPFPGFEDVVFSPLQAQDLADCLAAMMERGLAGTYHVAGSEACSKYEFGVRLARTFGLDETLVQPATLAQAGLRAPRPRNTSLDTTRIGRALGRPMPGIDAGLRRFRRLRDQGVAAELKEAVKGREHACV